MLDNNEKSSRLEDKIDKITDKISSIDITLAAQHIILDEHIKRTKLLEKRLDPIEKHDLMVSSFLKFLGMPISLLMIVAAITEILGYFKR